MYTATKRLVHKNFPCNFNLCKIYAKYLLILYYCLLARRKWNALNALSASGMLTASISGLSEILFFFLVRQPQLLVTATNVIWLFSHLWVSNYLRFSYLCMQWTPCYCCNFFPLHLDDFFYGQLNSKIGKYLIFMMILSIITHFHCWRFN